MKLTMQSFRRILLLPFAVLGLFILGVALPLPDVTFLKTHNPHGSAFALNDSRIHNKKTIFTPLSQVPLTLIKAILLAEDDRFFQHQGFNFDSIRHALIQAQKLKRPFRGGSTLTQQLSRNLFLDKRRTLLRKAREALLTLRLENSLSKMRILELYLNTVEMGPGIYGIREATLYHFGKEPNQILPAQAATLAALLPNPVKRGKKPYPPSTLKYQKHLLSLMETSNLILPEPLLTLLQKNSSDKEKTNLSDGEIR